MNRKDLKGKNQLKCQEMRHAWHLNQTPNKSQTLLHTKLSPWLLPGPFLKQEKNQVDQRLARGGQGESPIAGTLSHTNAPLFKISPIRHKKIPTPENCSNWDTPWPCETFWWMFKRKAVFVLRHRDFAIAWTWARTSLFSLFFLPPLDRCDRQQAKPALLFFQTPSYKSINKLWVLWTSGIDLQETASNIGLSTTNTIGRLVEERSRQIHHAHN